MPSRPVAVASIHATPSTSGVLCPRCGDGELSSHLVQEHRSCGCVLLAGAFTRGADSTCPKCLADLTSSDISTVGVLYVCDGCGDRLDSLPANQER